eukprot:GILJ01004789.1.p1 GENE.GILJ01004789.1~~GILJ01004789.1.p1  ORF type:complete len:625 (-),score=82.28 GILJ01004789.1:226-2061(-)
MKWVFVFVFLCLLAVVRVSASLTQEQHAENWWRVRTTSHATLAEKAAITVQEANWDLDPFLDHIAAKLKQDDVKCHVCKLIVTKVQGMVRSGITKPKVLAEAVKICLKVSGQPQIVCEGIIAEFAPPVLEIFVARIIDPADTCAWIHACPSPGHPPFDREKWIQDVLNDPRPTPIPTPTPAPSAPVEVVAGANETGSFLAISDIHVDLLYKKGTNAHCGNPVCCREEDGPGDASYWGDYECDLNLPFFEHFLQTAVALKPDFVIVSGDIPPHDVWEQTKETQKHTNTVVYQLMKQYFQTTPVYPVLGNHGCFPVDMFEPSWDVWLLENLADLWSSWLPADALATMRKWGYYTMKHSEKIRIIGLNTQYCDMMNFWLILSSDPGHQMEWLRQTLRLSEQNGEKVYIIGHIPVNNIGCLAHFGNMYQALLDRYRDVVAGQFFGHTHQDHFMVNRAVHDRTATGVMFMIPSLTPGGNRDPGFRSYQFDPSSGLIQDYVQYHSSLKAAIDDPKVGPTFQPTYSAIQSYGLASMQPSEWDKLSSRLKTDPATFHLYSLHYENRHDPAGCENNAQCKLDRICEASECTFSSYLKCSGDKMDFDIMWNYLLQRLDKHR